jgi:hypothetical protein
VTSRARSLLADVIVGVVVFIVVIWLLRRVVGMILWVASLLALVLVVVALLALARWVRKG